MPRYVPERLDNLDSILEQDPNYDKSLKVRAAYRERYEEGFSNALRQLRAKATAYVSSAKEKIYEFLESPMLRLGMVPHNTSKGAIIPKAAMSDIQKSFYRNINFTNFGDKPELTEEQMESVTAGVPSFEAPVVPEMTFANTGEQVEATPVFEPYKPSSDVAESTQEADFDTNEVSEVPTTPTFETYEDQTVEQPVSAVEVTKEQPVAERAMSIEEILEVIRRFRSDNQNLSANLLSKEAEIKKMEEGYEVLRKSNVDLQDQLRRVQLELQAQKQITSQLQGDNEALQSNISKLGDKHSTEIIRLNEMHDKALADKDAIIEASRSKYEREINARDERIAVIESEAREKEKASMMKLQSLLTEAIKSDSRIIS